MRRANKVNSIIVVSDFQIGCTFGLCHRDGFDLDEGGVYQPSRMQRVVWDKWEQFWNDWVPRVTKGEPYDVVINGDILDGFHHRNVTHITANIERQRDHAVKVINEIKALPNCRKIYGIRGTEVHVGPSARKSARYQMNWVTLADGSCGCASTMR